jgi:hypothetical protein
MIDRVYRWHDAFLDLSGHASGFFAKIPRLRPGMSVLSIRVN